MPPTCRPPSRDHGAGTATVTGAGNTGFTVAFAGTLANTDVAPLSIVNCTGMCTSSVRENSRAARRWRPGRRARTVTVGPITDADYNLSFGGTLAAVDVDPFTITNPARRGPFDGRPGPWRGILHPGGPRPSPLGGGHRSTTGFQVPFGGTLAGLDQRRSC